MGGLNFESPSSETPSPCEPDGFRPGIPKVLGSYIGGQTHAHLSQSVNESAKFALFAHFFS
jgi:hypothetical protein